MHPAHQAFQKWLHGKSPACIGQIRIQAGDRFELRHQLDEAAPSPSLASYSDPFAARALATYTDAGKFRPLKSAPNLRRGWRIAGLDFDGLITALDCFYPAAIVHWHAQQTGQLEATSYRACAARQTGMYRITTKLTDEQAQRVAACCCEDGECLKQPSWTIDEKTKLELSKPKVIDTNRLPIPCPEPCSLLLSFARKVVRLEQEEIMDVKFTRSDLELIGTVLRGVLAGTNDDYREGDYSDPRHRQRIRYFLKTHEHLPAPAENGSGEAEE
jgi:hypothetical protein